MFVRNWMSAPAIVLGPDVTASAALAFMEKRRIRRVPVVQDGKLVGMVTKSDLLGAGSKPHVSGVTRIAHVMTPKPLTVPEEATLEAAAQLMLSKKISGLPVMDGDKVVGILTESAMTPTCSRTSAAASRAWRSAASSRCTIRAGTRGMW
jgi:CBS domain-containing protein